MCWIRMRLSVEVLVSQDPQSAIEDTQVLIHTTVPSCPHLILFMWVCLSSYEELNNFVVAMEAGNY